MMKRLHKVSQAGLTTSPVGKAQSTAFANMGECANKDLRIQNKLLFFCLTDLSVLLIPYLFLNPASEDLKEHQEVCSA